MTDRLFSLQQLDPEPKASPRPAAERATIGEDGIYEVEAIVDQRTFKTRKQFLVKWEGYPESHGQIVPEQILLEPDKATT